MPMLAILREFDREHLIYDPPKPGFGGSGPQCLTPLELLDRLAALVPPPRLHRHRYFGVLAPTRPCAPRSPRGRPPRRPHPTRNPPPNRHIVAPARGPPLWQAAGAEHEPTADPALPPIPADEFDQRITW